MTASLWAFPAGAQLGDLEQPRPSDERLELPEIEPEAVEPEFVLPPIPEPPEDGPLRAGPRFVLRGVRLTGNTVFGGEELQSVAAEYVGRVVSSIELEELRRKLSLYYVDRGHINSGALLPDQEVRDGVVTYAIVEGTLSQIDVFGNERLRARYVERRLRLGSGAVLNVEQLQDRIELLLQDPAIDGIAARLGPGERLGESELRVRVEESSPVSVRLSLANARSPSVGAEEGQGIITLRNLSGWGEALSLRFSRTEGLREDGVEFGVPITARDTILTLRVEDSESEVIEEPFSIVDVQSESRGYAIRIDHPLYRTLTREFSVGVEVARRESRTFLLGRGFPFSDGVEDDGSSTVNVMRLSQSWLDRGRDRVLAVRSTFSFGFDAFGATGNPSPCLGAGGLTLVDPCPDGEFFVWLGQLQWARRLTEAGHQVIMRADVQLTPDRLLPLEKFAIGGADTVRGYRENLLVRDNGWVASIEGRIPLLRLPLPGISKGGSDGLLEFAPFFDYGRSWNRAVATPEPTTIYSVGLGLRWRPSRRVFASIYVGEQLNDVDDPEDDLQDRGVHFRLNANLF